MNRNQCVSPIMMPYMDSVSRLPYFFLFYTAHTTRTKLMQFTADSSAQHLFLPHV